MSSSIMYNLMIVVDDIVLYNWHFYLKGTSILIQEKGASILSDRCVY